MYKLLVIMLMAACNPKASNDAADIAPIADRLFVADSVPLFILSDDEPQSLGLVGGAGGAGGAGRVVYRPSGGAPAEAFASSDDFIRAYKTGRVAPHGELSGASVDVSREESFRAVPQGGGVSIRPRGEGVPVSYRRKVAPMAPGDPTVVMESESLDELVVKLARNIDVLEPQHASHREQLFVEVGGALGADNQRRAAAVRARLATEYGEAYVVDEVDLVGSTGAPTGMRGIQIRRGQDIRVKEPGGAPIGTPIDRTTLMTGMVMPVGDRDALPDSFMVAARKGRFNLTELPVGWVTNPLAIAHPALGREQETFGVNRNPFATAPRSREAETQVAQNQLTIQDQLTGLMAGRARVDFDDGAGRAVDPMATIIRGPRIAAGADGTVFRLGGGEVVKQFNAGATPDAMSREAALGQYFGTLGISPRFKEIRRSGGGQLQIVMDEMAGDLDSSAPLGNAGMNTLAQKMQVISQTHLDLDHKPPNVLVNARGEPFPADFGRVVADLQPGMLPAKRELMGSYNPPEFADAQDGRTISRTPGYKKEQSQAYLFALGLLSTHFRPKGSFDRTFLHPNAARARVDYRLDTFGAHHPADAWRWPVRTINTQILGARASFPDLDETSFNMLVHMLNPVPTQRPSFADFLSRRSAGVPAAAPGGAGP